MGLFGFTPGFAYLLATYLNAHPLLARLLSPKYATMVSGLAAVFGAVINVDQIYGGTRADMAGLTLPKLIWQSLKTLACLPLGTMVAASLMNAFGINADADLNGEPPAAFLEISQEILINLAYFMFTWFVQAGAESFAVKFMHRIAAAFGNVSAQKASAERDLGAAASREEALEIQAELITLMMDVERKFSPAEMARLKLSLETKKANLAAHNNPANQATVKTAQAALDKFSADREAAFYSGLHKIGLRTTYGNVSMWSTRYQSLSENGYFSCYAFKQMRIFGMCRVIIPICHVIYDPAHPKNPHLFECITRKIPIFGQTLRVIKKKPMLNSKGLVWRMPVCEH